MNRDIDTAHIAQTVAAIGILADLRYFDLIERLFAASVEMDYSSLWGGSPQAMSRAELRAAWSGLLPGFEGTYHQLGLVTAEAIADDLYAARCKVTARHWLGEGLWALAGAYEFRLRREGTWRVEAMRFILGSETGDRGLVAAAQARAAATA